MSYPAASLGSVTKIINGGTPDTSKPEYWDGGVAWLTPKDMGRSKTLYLSETSRTLSKVGVESSSARIVPPGSVILSTRAPIGHLIINDVPMSFNQGCRGLVPGRELDAKYLFYFLSANVELLNDLGTGTTFKELSAGALAGVRLPVPSLAEQERIVAVLDEAFEAIATATANTQRAMLAAEASFVAERESRLVKNVPARWCMSELRQVIGVKHGFAFSSEFFSEDGEHVLLTPGNFYEAGGYRDRGTLQKRYTGPVPAGFTLAPGSLLLAMTEQAAGLLGSPLFVPKGAVHLHNQRLGLVELKSKGASSRYFFHLFNTCRVRQELHATGTGTKVRHTSPDRIGAVRVNVAPVEEQAALADHLDRLATQVEDLKQKLTRKLALLAELKPALLAQAFSGELTAAKPANDNAFATPEQVANVIAFAQRRHEMRGRQQTYGRVKAQKNLHLVESVGGVDLDRRPEKDAAGPNDFQHMLAAERWAKSQGFFEFVQQGQGYGFKKLANYKRCIAAADAALAPIRNRIERATDLIIDLDSRAAEVLATVHAAWNNLVLDGVDVTSDAIIREARDDWHPAKLKIPVSEFREAIQSIRRLGIVPDGSAKRVGQPRLL